MAIYFDTNKEAYNDLETLENWGKTLLITVTEEEYQDILESKLIWRGNKIVENPDYEEEKKQKEREELDKLSLTKREVFLAVYKDKGITPEQIRSQITNEEALIEFDYANDYFRGNPLINSIGVALGYTTEDLDYLFEHGELPEKPEEDEEQPEPDTTEEEADATEV